MKLEDAKQGVRVRISEGYRPSDRNKQIGRTGTISSVSAQGYISILFDDTKKEEGLWFAQEMEPLDQQKKDFPLLPDDPKERKRFPVASGVLDYFTAALIEVARVSQVGNDQHNPGQPLHWARGKSTDQADTMIRHFLERGTLDSDGVRHSAKMCWRALAILQLELEAEGAPIARGARLPEEKK